MPRLFTRVQLVDRYAPGIKAQPKTQGEAARLLPLFEKLTATTAAVFFETDVLSVGGSTAVYFPFFHTHTQHARGFAFFLLCSARLWRRTH